MADFAYKLICQDIRSSMANGELPTGTKLPTTAELCETYGVSKITVKRAMDELVRAGLVVRRRGSGTYVLETSSVLPIPDGSWDNEDSSEGFAAECARRGHHPNARVHEVSVVSPPREVRKALSLDEDALCHYIERTLLADDEPVLSETAYIPVSIAPTLDEGVAAKSLFAYATDTLGLRIARSPSSTTAGPSNTPRHRITPTTAILRRRGSKARQIRETPAVRQKHSYAKREIHAVWTSRFVVTLDCTCA